MVEDISKAEHAATLYLARRDGAAMPHLFTAPDGFAYPFGYEVQPCCFHVTPPNSRHQDTLVRHCYSLKHCAMFWNADVSEVESAVRRFQSRTRKITHAAS